MNNKISGNTGLASLWNYLKLNQNILLSSALVIAVGVFLLPKNVFASSISAEKILELTNKERTKAGVSQLMENNLLTSAASAKAQAILEYQEFSHSLDDKKFSSWIKNAGYEYRAVGENLAIDFITSEGVMKGWLASADHKKNLLKPNYSEIGIATIKGIFRGQETTVVVQLFGEPLSPAISLIPMKIIKKQEILYPANHSVLSSEEIAALSAKKTIAAGGATFNFFFTVAFISLLSSIIISNGLSNLIRKLALKKFKQLTLF